MGTSRVHHEGTKDTKVRKLSLFLRALRVLRGEVSFLNFAPFAFFAAIPLFSSVAAVPR
jgi:hypothetical protein